MVKPFGLNHFSYAWSWQIENYVKSNHVVTKANYRGHHSIGLRLFFVLLLSN
jgi:hypothetical protein